MPSPDPETKPAPLTILVVDDEETVRETLAWLLLEAGHVVHQAADGLLALRFLDENGPVDLVLSDVNMPRMDGLELCVRVRERWPGLPVLLISGRPPPSGKRPFVPKPFRWETLSLAIHAVVADGAGGERTA